jgi:hypothetical protein
MQHSISSEYICDKQINESDRHCNYRARAFAIEMDRCLGPALHPFDRFGRNELHRILMTSLYGKMSLNGMQFFNLALFTTQSNVILEHRKNCETPRRQNALKKDEDEEQKNKIKPIVDSRASKRSKNAKQKTKVNPRKSFKNDVT